MGRPRAGESKYDWLVATLAGIEYDPTKHWSEYPCVEWPWGKNTGGYGHVRLPVKAGDKLIVVHRIVLERALGRPIKDEYFSCHHCDNRPCFHPAHLFEGTRDDNMKDMVNKGRGRNRSREDHNLAKLNWEKVREARAMRADGWTIKQIAGHFGLVFSSTRCMLIGETWAEERGSALLDTVNHNLGATHHKAKLTPEKAAEIRKLGSRGYSNE